ncbi:MAG: glutamate-5-semialdehyde dehydrogenase [Clostridia bacterium]|nr:glutamate-5-semialdehyde dehydrogenase [Clostridia bacterium]
METIDIIKKTKAAVKFIKTADAETKNRAINLMAESVISSTKEILAANMIDIENAKGKISDVMIDRLMLNEERIKSMAKGMKEITLLNDPVGETLSETLRPNGLKIIKKRVPMGLIAIIYESRPNVTSDAASLAVKSGNAVVLRGGKEAYNTSKAIVDALKKGLASAGLSSDIINLVSDLTRESASVLMTAEGLVDLLIPRGGAGLINACVKNATVPCIHTGTGICHIYVDKDADLLRAIKILENAKTSRPSVCNAAEVLLVHEAVAEKFLPKVNEVLSDKRKAEGKIPVELRLCEKAAKIIDGNAAGENDFDTEFLDYILAVRVVSSASEAIEHILKHSTGHSEAIITENKDTAEIFVTETDSAAVYINASTRFTDGGEFGLGCEMGISTQKMHARGPMGLSELTAYKYIIEGNGQVR